MSIVVTGATGHLGRLVVEQLLEKVPAGQVTAVVRDESRAADLAARGVRLAVADYNAPETFDGLFSAGDKVLLISGNEFAKGRVQQHKVVIEAARAAGVALLAYTSAPASLTASLADDHRGTEEALLASGLPYALLRNGWYHENYTEQLGTVLEHGAVVAAAGEGGSPPPRVRTTRPPRWRCSPARATRTRPTSWAATRRGASPSTRPRSAGRPARRSATPRLHRAVRGHPDRRRGPRALRGDARERGRRHRRGRAGGHDRRPLPPGRPPDHAAGRRDRGGAQGLTPRHSPDTRGTGALRPPRRPGSPGCRPRLS